MNFTKTQTHVTRQSTMLHHLRAKSFYQNPLTYEGYPDLETSSEEKFVFELQSVYVMLNDLKKNYNELLDVFQEIRTSIINISIPKESLRIHAVEINELISEKWELHNPLKVTIEEHNVEDFAACFYEANIYGYGDTIPSAIQDLQISILNQFEFLIEQEKKIKLGTLPANQLIILKRIMKKRHHYAKT